MDELLAEFIAETRESLETIAGEIVAWEANPTDRERLDLVFRFVHTVKGSCGFLDLNRLQRLSHEAESALQELRDGKLEPNPALVSTILAIIDRIGVLVDALESGAAIDESVDEALIAALTINAEGGEEFAAPVRAVAPDQRNPARSIRVPVELLDRLMSGVSDLVLARNELSRQLRRVQGDHNVETAFERMSGCVADMRDAITWTRMQRIESLFQALPRLVRDLSADLSKSVALEIDGADVELDREMIEMLRDPLTHIVRNALDHGIESPDDRRNAGKDVNGALRIAARQSGNQIQISITDDGRGIDPDKLVERAVAAGCIDPLAAEQLSDEHALELIFQPGLSTAKEVSAISGRGVGMDVVRSNVERIGGTIEIESVKGEGTTLVLSVPLTLTIIPALIFGTASGQFAISRAGIEEIVSLNTGSARLESVGGTEIAEVRGRRIPVVRLAAMLGAGVKEEADAKHLAILRSSRRERFALVVSDVFDHEELVVKPAAPCIMASGVYAGTALPDNGRPLLLLDIAGLAAAAGLRLSLARQVEAEGEKGERKATAGDALIFEDLDGKRRAIRMGIVERIVDADVSQIAESAGALRLTRDDETIRVVANGTLPDEGIVRILRLNDGSRTLAYAVKPGLVDVIPFPATFEPASVPGPVSGVAVIEGSPVEIIDPHFLFAAHGAVAVPKERPRCLVLGGDDLWRHEMLAPLIEAAGYEVSFDESDEEAAVVIDASDASAASVSDADNVVRLTADPAGENGLVYRYDRTGIFAALDARLKAQG
jgi:two-component system chemotaxis sensor kinase CheA